jgi:chemotaxis protein histidine kinase CheA
VVSTGKMTPNKMDDFLEEAALLVGQWDEACCSLESGRDPREVLQGVGNILQALKRSSRNIGHDTFSKTVSILSEYLRIVLKINPIPSDEAAKTLAHSQGVFFRWLMELRMDSPPDDALLQLKDQISSYNDAIYQILEEQKLPTPAPAGSAEVSQTARETAQIDESQWKGQQSISDEWCVPQSLEAQRSRTIEPEDTPEASNPDERVSEHQQNLIQRTDVPRNLHLTASNEIFDLVAQIFMQQCYLEHLLQKDDHSKRELLRTFSKHSRMISSLVGKVVSTQFTKTDTFLDQLTYLLNDFSNMNAVKLTCVCDVDGLEMDAETLETLWEPMSQLLCQTIGALRECAQAGETHLQIRIRGRSEGAIVRLSVECLLPQANSWSLIVPVLPYAESALMLSRSSGGAINISSDSDVALNIDFVVPISARFPEIVFVVSGGESYAVHRHMIREIVDEDEFNSYSFHGSQRVIEIGGLIYPFVRLDHLLEWRSQGQTVSIDDIKCHQVILVQFGVQTVAIGIEEVSEPSRMIVKNLQRHLAKVPGLCGTVIARDGSPIPVIDVVGLVAQHVAQHPMGVAA